MNEHDYDPPGPDQPLARWLASSADDWLSSQPTLWLPAVPAAPEPGAARRPDPPGPRRPDHPQPAQRPPAQQLGRPRTARRRNTRTRRAPLATSMVALLVVVGTVAFVMFKPSSPGTGSGTAGTDQTTGTEVARTTASGEPSLVLTAAAVKIGDSYNLTAAGFVPGEQVRISWTGPTTGTMGDSPADANGTRIHGPILERDPPGRYLIIATGLRSGQTVTAPLTVLPRAATGEDPVTPDG